MIDAVLIGIASGVLVKSIPIVRAMWPSVQLAVPVLVLLVTLLGVLTLRFGLTRSGDAQAFEEFEGLPDLILHIHDPSTTDTVKRWTLRGVLSYFYSLFTGVVGVEGGAIEIGQAIGHGLRTRSERWSEQRRRTDAAASVAAAVAAAFSAPFAGVLVAVEMGLGGRSLYVVTAALSAFLVAQGMDYAVTLGWFLPMGTWVAPLSLMPGVYFFDLRSINEWGGIGLLALLSFVAGVILISGVRFLHGSMRGLFQTRVWMRFLSAGMLLFLLTWMGSKGGSASPQQALGLVMTGQWIGKELAFQFVLQMVAFAVVISGLGSTGVLWPVFVLGAMLGGLLEQGLSFLGPESLGVFSVLGAVSLVSVVWNTPLAAAVLGYEMTQSLTVLLPAMVLAFGVKQLRMWVGVRPLIEYLLENRGVSLVDGRSRSVLDRLRVSEAMVTDYETVFDHESVKEIHGRLLKSRYPFLPVVNAQGQYVGLLTVDMVQEAWNKSPDSGRGVLEARDLLYHAAFKTPTVRSNEKLSVTSGLFDRVPCVSVLSDDARVIGLLFSYHVRLAYDREVARRALSMASSHNRI